MADLVIAKRFCGPPTSANGGYTCGSLAQRLGGVVEVTLRSPPPLEAPLEVRERDEGLEVHHGATLVAQAKPSSIELDIPEPPSFEEASEAATRYRYFENHPYPTCFVCGPQRSVGDGMRIFAGPMAERSLVAAPFVPDGSLGVPGESRGVLPLPIVWAALDCPSWFGGEMAQAERCGALLARFTVQTKAEVAIGERCVVAGWHLATDGRKVWSASALFGEGGELKGFGKALWIKVS